ncbi:MAG: BRO family protein [Bacteroidales bacterium]|nr:BRO family protein [Bacteroidales bacterium]
MDSADSNFQTRFVRPGPGDQRKWRTGVCLSDVCQVLALSNSARVKTRLDKGVVSSNPLETAGWVQQALFVTEDGLYDVILDSRKPEAKQFQLC